MSDLAPLFTYLMYSTVVLSLAWLLDVWLIRDPSLRDTLWKTAMAVSVVAPLLALATPGPSNDRHGVTQLRYLRLGERFEGAEPGALSVVRQRGEVDARCIRDFVPGAGAGPMEVMSAIDRCAAGGEGRAWIVVIGLLSAGFALRHFGQTIRLNRVVRSASRAELNGAFDVLVHPHVTGPFAAGFKTVVLPARSVDEMSPAQVDAVLAHEFAHLRRRDPLWQWGARLLEGVCFFQPLNRLCRRRLEEVAELICDDCARSTLGGGRALAESIALVGGWRFDPELASFLARRRGLAAHRVSRLLGPEPLIGLPQFHLRAAVVLGLVSAAAALPALPRSAATTQVEISIERMGAPTPGPLQEPW